MKNRLEAIIPESDWTCQSEKKSSLAGDEGYCIESVWEPLPAIYLPSKLAIAQELSRALRESPTLKLRRELEELKDTVKAQGRMIEMLLVSEEPKVPSEDAYDIWLKSEEAKKYAGRYIAYMRGRGVIASASELEQLMPQIEGLKEQEEIVIEIIPRASK